MPVTSIVLVAALAALREAEYSPTLHLATISARLKEVSAKLKEVDEAGAPISPVGKLLGQYIGEDRKNQAYLTTYLRKARGSESVVALNTVRASGLWQAYLASAVLGLDGDAESKDLAVLLEKRLVRLLPLSAKG